MFLSPFYFLYIHVFIVHFVFIIVLNVCVCVLTYHNNWRFYFSLSPYSAPITAVSVRGKSATLQCIHICLSMLLNIWSWTDFSPYRMFFSHRQHTLTSNTFFSICNGSFAGFKFLFLFPLLPWLLLLLLLFLLHCAHCIGGNPLIIMSINRIWCK